MLLIIGIAKLRERALIVRSLREAAQPCCCIDETVRAPSRRSPAASEFDLPALYMYKPMLQQCSQLDVLALPHCWAQHHGVNDYVC